MNMPTRQLPLNLQDDDQENLKVIRMIFPSLTSDAAAIRDALAFRVSTAPQPTVKRARKLIRETAEIGAQPQLVWQWAHGKRPIPADRRPDIERATGGEVTCEEMTSDEVVWSRISDAHWKWHPLGRPVRDLTREAA